MQIEEICLSNWVSYPEQWIVDGERKTPTLRFVDEPVYLIYGRNGSGKSSVMDGIIFALYGDYPRRERADGSRMQEIKTEEAIRSGEKSASVQLTFQCNNQRHRITRRLGKASASYELWDAAKSKWIVQTTDGKQVTKRVVKLLGMDSKLFRATVMLEQGRTSRFMEMDAPEQVTHITQLIGLDAYDAYYEKAKKLANERKGKIDNLDQELGELKDASPERQAALDKEKQETDDLLKKLALERENLTKRQEQLRVITKLKREISELAQTMDADKKKIERTAEIHAAVQLVNGWTRVEPHLASLRNARTRATQAEQEIEGLHLQAQRTKELEEQSIAKVAELEPQHQAAVSQVADAERALGEKRKAFDTARAQRELIEGEVKLAKTIDELNAAQEIRAKRLENFETYKSEAQIHTELVQAVPSFKVLLGKLAQAQVVFDQGQVEQEQMAKREQELRERQADIEKKQAERKKQDKEVQTSRDEADEIKSAWQSATALLQNRELAHGKAECPTCGTPMEGKILDRFHAELAVLDSKVKSLNDQKSIATSRANDIAKQAERDQKKLDKLIEETRDAERELKINRKTWKDKLEDAKRNERDAKTEWQELVGEIQFSRTLFTEPTQACYDAIVIQRKLLKRSADKYDELKDTQGEWNAAKKELKRLERERQHPAGTFSESDLQNARQTEKRLSAEITKAEAALKTLREQERAVSNSLRDARTDLTTARRDLNRLTKTDLPAATKRRIDAQGDEQRALQRLSEIEATLEWDARARALLSSAIEGNEKNETALQARVTAARPLAQELPALETAERTLERTRAKHETLKKKLEEYPEDTQRETEESVAKQLEKNTEAQKKGDSTRSELEHMLREVKRQLEEKKRKEKKRAELETEREGLLHLEQLLAPPRAEIPDGGLLRQHILRGTLCQIGAHASRILDEWGQAIDVIVPTERLAFRMVDRTSSNAERHFRLFSGGEKFMVALAIALAIGELAGQIGHPECLFLDEGFGLLDAENRARVAREIVSGLLSSGRRKQVVVITHMDDVQAAFHARYHLVHNGSFTQLYEGANDGIA